METIIKNITEATPIEKMILETYIKTEDLECHKQFEITSFGKARANFLKEYLNNKRDNTLKITENKENLLENNIRNIILNEQERIEKYNQKQASEVFFQKIDFEDISEQILEMLTENNLIDFTETDDILHDFMNKFDDYCQRGFKTYEEFEMFGEDFIIILRGAI